MTRPYKHLLSPPLFRPLATGFEKMQKSDPGRTHTIHITTPALETSQGLFLSVFGMRTEQYPKFTFNLDVFVHIN